MSRRAAHRRTYQAWQQLHAALYAAQLAVLDLERQLAEERRKHQQERMMRTVSDALMGRIVAARIEAEKRAAQAERSLVIERQRQSQANGLVAGLRAQLAQPEPRPSSQATQEIPRPVVVPLGSDRWRIANAS